MFDIVIDSKTPIVCAAGKGIVIFLEYVPGKGNAYYEEKARNSLQTVDFLLLNRLSQLHCTYESLLRRWNVDFVVGHVGNSQDVSFLSAKRRLFKWSRLAEIVVLLDEGYIRNALLQALLVADICSSIHAPNHQSSEQCFKNWIEDTIRRYEPGSYGVDVVDKEHMQNRFSVLTGSICWHMRNSLVHGCLESVDTVVNKSNTILKKKYGYHYVDVVFTDGYYSFAEEYKCLKDNKEVKVLFFELSLSALILKIVCMAETEYEENFENNKLYFSDGYTFMESSDRPLEIADVFVDKYPDEIT